MLSNTPLTPVHRTKILLLGLKRAGKTSLLKVIFDQLPPKQTFYIETTNNITKHYVDTVIPLEIWDTPANVTVEELGDLAQFAAIIFVIDIRDLYNQPIAKLVEFIVASQRLGFSQSSSPNPLHPNNNAPGGRGHDPQNPQNARRGPSIEVFVHKAEKLQEDDKIENYRQINDRVIDNLLDRDPNFEDHDQVPINFYLTSVYDHSAWEAASKVLQKLVDSLPYIEELLNVFCANSQCPKAFLFDPWARLHVATDASPVDAQTHNLCCDWLDTLGGLGGLYKSTTSRRERLREPIKDVVSQPRTGSRRGSGASSAGIRMTPASNASNTGRANSLTVDEGIDHDEELGGDDGVASQEGTIEQTPKRRHKALFYPSASTTLSGGSGTPGTTLTYHLITTPFPPPSAPVSQATSNMGSISPSANTNTASSAALMSAADAAGADGPPRPYAAQLALVAVIPTNVYETRRGLLEYNVVFFREGVQEICEVEWESRAIAGEN